MPSAAIRFVRSNALAGALLSAIVACDGGATTAPADAAAEAMAPSSSAPSEATPSSAPAAAAPSSRSSESAGSQAVYPITNDPPDPRAQRLCEALNGVPVDRKAACCKTKAGFTQTGECTRTLSASLRAGAVTIDDAAIDACSAAMAKQHEGCAWVGTSLQKVPQACLGVVRGTRKAKVQCRSSLECEGGLRCQGVGPTDVGVCLPPKPSGFACDTATDPLAGFVRQSDYDAAH
jgi:hypothetical protein